MRRDGGVIVIDPVRSCFPRGYGKHVHPEDGQRPVAPRFLAKIGKICHSISPKGGCLESRPTEIGSRHIPWLPEGGPGTCYTGPAGKEAYPSSGQPRIYMAQATNIFMYKHSITPGDSLPLDSNYTSCASRPDNEYPGYPLKLYQCKPDAKSKVSTVGRRRTELTVRYHISRPVCSKVPSGVWKYTFTRDFIWRTAF